MVQKTGAGQNHIGPLSEDLVVSGLALAGNLARAQPTLSAALDTSKIITWTAVWQRGLGRSNQRHTRRGGRGANWHKNIDSSLKIYSTRGSESCAKSLAF